MECLECMVCLNCMNCMEFFERKVCTVCVVCIACMVYIIVHQVIIYVSSLHTLCIIPMMRSLLFMRSSHDEIIAFYADFSKAFDKVPHKLLLRKLSDIGVGGCLLKIIYDYLRNRRQFVRVDFYTPTVLEITSGVPQGSLLGPLLFCVFINDLPEVLRFSDPSIFAVDLTILSVGRKQDEIQLDLNKIEDWVRQNNMELAFEKCAQINFRGVDINL